MRLQESPQIEPVEAAKALFDSVDESLTHGHYGDCECSEEGGPYYCVPVSVQLSDIDALQQLHPSALRTMVFARAYLIHFMGTLICTQLNFTLKTGQSIKFVDLELCPEEHCIRFKFCFDGHRV